MALLLAVCGAGWTSSAGAQPCPTPAAVVSGTTCTDPPGSTRNITTAGANGYTANGTGGRITADNVTVNLGAAGTTGELALGGGVLSFNGSRVITTSGAGNATGQTGLRAIGGGSLVTAAGATVSLASTSGTSSNIVGVTAELGGSITLIGTNVLVRGGVNGIGNRGVQALGAGSSVQFVAGSINADLSRGSFGVLALDGGVVNLSGGTQVTSSGAQTTGASPIASHALIAIGSGSLVTGNGITVSTSGTLANGARAEGGGSVQLTSSTISTSGAGTTGDPSAALRAVSGGVLTVNGVGTSISATGQFGHGVSVQGAGSQAFVSDATIVASGNRSIGVSVLDGGAFTAANSAVLATNGPAIDIAGAGSTLTLSNVSATSTAATGAAIRLNNGATGTVTGGSIATQGRDGTGLFAATSTVTATNVAITTSGTDNAMGVIADLGGQITLNGGSVLTSGDSVRAGARAHGLAARNPGGTLIANGTTVRTQGAEAMGVVADDGGSVVLNGNSITTQGTLGLGLFSVVEQLGPQFAASILANGVTVETFGPTAYGANAQQNFFAAPALVTLNDSAVTTHGLGSVGLRAISAGTVIANRTTVLTEGVAAHGVLARDSPSSVTLNDSTVLSTGALAHGAVVQNGGLVNGTNSTVTATGANAAALFAVGAPGVVSTANFSGSRLTNSDGPTIAVAGPATISLSRSMVSGSGQWLVVGTSANFAPLSNDPPLTGIPDLDSDAPVPPLGAPPPLPVTPGLANIDVSNSLLVGAATTLPGSTSNVVLRNNSLWIMTGSSNLTSLTNNQSLIAFTGPSGDVHNLASYKTLTVVNYVGQGGTVGLNTYLAGTGSPSDRLVINGGSATGQSFLRIGRAGGGGALTIGDGILVVDAHSTTAPGAFRLAAPVLAGPFEYTLHRGGASNGEAWFLRSTVDCSATPGNPNCASGNTGGDPNDPITTAPNFRPEVSLFAAVPAAALIYGRRLLGTLHERMGDSFGTRLGGGGTSFANADCTTDDCTGLGGRAWGRLISFHGNRNSTQGIYGDGPSYRYDMTALQVGSDLWQNVDTERGRDSAGVFGAFGTSATGVTHADTLYAGNDLLSGYSLGAYWTHYGVPGWYVDAVLQGTWYDMNVQPARALPASRVTGFGVGGSLEGGYPFNLGGGVRLEPQLQLVYQTINLGQTSDIAAQIQFGNVQSLAGRIGARVVRTWDAGNDTTPHAITTWFRANVWNEFLGKPQTSFSSENGFIPFNGDISGAWGEINVGVDAQFSRRGSFYVSASYLSSFTGDRQGYDGKIGVKFTW